MKILEKYFPLEEDDADIGEDVDLSFETQDAF